MGKLAVTIGILVVAGSIARAQVIDRILAVVDNSLVTQSDVTAAMRLGLETPAPAADPVAAVVDRLIERRLTLSEVDRYAPPEPSAADINLRLEKMRQSFPSTAAFEAVLNETGLDEAQLRRHVRDDLRIAAYLQQRFGSPVQPSDEQILDYYRAHPGQFTRNGVLRPFDEAHDDVRAAIVEQRRSAVIRDWVTGLRRRANISLLYAAR